MVTVRAREPPPLKQSPVRRLTSRADLERVWKEIERIFGPGQHYSTSMVREQNLWALSAWEDGKFLCCKFTGTTCALILALGWWQLPSSALQYPTLQTHPPSMQSTAPRYEEHPKKRQLPPVSRLQVSAT